MSMINRLIVAQLKLKENGMQFILLFLFWLIGFVYFLITEPMKDLFNIFLLSLTVRTSSSPSDFGNFFALIWPILLEVVVIGFFMGTLLEKFNPVVTSAVRAKHQKNHTVIIGYHHLAELIVNECVNKKKPFCVIEDNEEIVEDLINAGYPVIIGDATETSNLLNANIEDAKEVFICIDDVRIDIVCAEKIRNHNEDCQIYARIFEEHVKEYLSQEPYNTHCFSTSKWALNAVEKWTEGKEGKAIVIGRDNLAQRISHHISLQPNREIYFFNDEDDGISFKENEQLHIINDLVRYLSDLRRNVNLNEVTQVFIFWKRESEFDEAIYLTSKLRLRYPHIKIYVRIFDKELKKLVKNYGAETFSSSEYAFKLLQEQVKPNSVLYQK